MTGREALRLALNHQPGPVPVDFGASAVTGIHCSLVAQLRERYGLERHPVLIADPFQMLGVVEEDLRLAMGADIVGYPGLYDLMGMRHNGETVLWRTPWGQEVRMPADFRYREEHGRIYYYPPGGETPSAVMPEGGWFFDAIIRQGPFDEDDPDPADNLQEFGPLSEDSRALLCRAAADMRDTRLGVLGGPGGTGLGDIAMVPGISLAVPRGIRDIEEWYVSTAIRRDFLHAVFSRQTDIALENLRVYRELTGDIVQVISVCGTDFGTQTGTFCSPQTFRELYAPYYRRMNDWIHANTDWKTFKHCCGAAESLIGDFLDCGFDILNPVQWTAAGMDRRLLKEKYGRRLVFWGGGVDTQRTLPFGTPEEVRREVTDCLRIFSQDGGYVFNTIHNTQAKTPVENVIAMVDAVRDFNR